MQVKLWFALSLLNESECMGVFLTKDVAEHALKCHPKTYIVPFKIKEYDVVFHGIGAPTLIEVGDGA